MSVTELPIQFDRQEIAGFCRARGIRRLSLFGSVVREDFDPVESDVDVLADFEPAALARTGWEYFRYGEELGKILHHRVDFCAQLGQDIEAEVRREALIIHEQT